MIVYFVDIDEKDIIDMDTQFKSGTDISPLDIPLKGDMIEDFIHRNWEVVGRKHYFIQSVHEMRVFLRKC